MTSKYLVIVSLVVIAIAGLFYFRSRTSTLSPSIISPAGTSSGATPDNPLSIAVMRKRAYPGSGLVIEQTLAPGSNYQQYIASYMSDGLKIYGLLTVPDGTKPPSGWPVIIFNHGYIPPQQYRTTERYIAYVDAFARNGYIVFKSDYRGNGNSQGQPEGAYYAPSYAIDVLNALASVKRYTEADPNRIGMWGHSMGGNITLRDIVVDTKDIKAAVIWGGVVGSYYDLSNNWQRRVTYQPPPPELANRNSGRQQLISMYGPPATSSAFWQSIDPTAHLADITIPIQLHTGGADEEVPVSFSQNLYASLTKLGKIVEYYNYPGGDHNISSPNFEVAMQRSIDFFNTYLK
jgi:dipeptidyl aminopeptidase/acylaminoacyl peptidase